MSGEKIITELERSKLLSSLHKHLVWCGEEIPESITIDGKKMPLHDIIWGLVKKPLLSEDDEKTIGKYIVRLSET